ncbi:cytochrome P450 [Streptomyces chumphonensis]|uniref:Cytochrome P450 n=1 Tax=Streptomyces chumphonensis TaxID=1214925 RepID=A0A927F3Q3_9ACTN|nr:cytochrome P450 [Streptomyces chumphonensis]MBD3934974.1 cytochrome P450 [Streptomyces chumphonensis]
MSTEHPGTIIPVLDALARDGGDPVPVQLVSGNGWLVRSHQHVRQVLSDKRFSADDQLPGFPRLFAIPNVPGGLSFLRMDPPRHSVLRRVLTSMFTVHRVERMRPAVVAATRSLIEDMKDAGPPTDLIEAFALPLPSQVICNLLGVPYEDHATFQENSRRILSVTATEAEAGTAFMDLGDYLGSLADAKRRHPGDDLLSTVVRQQQEAGMTDEDVVAMARLLLIAGHETTANMLGMIVRDCFADRDLFELLRADTTAIGPAVEELLRKISIVRCSLGRLAVEDVRLTEEVTVRAGQGVVLGIWAANHDPDVYDDPHAYDLTREARTHVAFGYGVHQCLGQALARLELRVAVRELVDAFPGLAPCVPVEDIRLKENSLVMGVETLPVTW